MSFYRDTIHLWFLSFPFDQVSRTLGDLSVQGACARKRQQLEKKPRRQPDIAVTGNRPGTSNQQVRSKSFPAPQKKRTTQQRSLKNMLARRGKRGGKWPFLSGSPVPISSLLVTWSLALAFVGTVCVRRKHVREWGGQGERVKPPAGVSTRSCFLFPRGCSFAIFYKYYKYCSFLGFLTCQFGFSPSPCTSGHESYSVVFITHSFAALMKSQSSYFTLKMLSYAKHNNKCTTHLGNQSLAPVVWAISWGDGLWTENLSLHVILPDVIVQVSIALKFIFLFSGFSLYW